MDYKDYVTGPPKKEYIAPKKVNTEPVDIFTPDELKAMNMAVSAKIKPYSQSAHVPIGGPNGSWYNRKK